VYDNLKTVVDAIFVGKECRFNRRFLTLANHYLFEPVACTVKTDPDPSTWLHQNQKIMAYHKLSCFKL
jgi:hypothetical protein